MKIILVGNPGTGKSTLLNALIGELQFKSGISMGTGMTKVLQKVEKNGIKYFDTVGFDDITMKEKAAQVITEALKDEDGGTKLVFVLTLSNGRVQAVDLGLIKLVLDALNKNVKVSYGIIVNQIKPEEKEMLQEEDVRKQMTDCLNSGRDIPTKYILFYDEVEELKGKKDIVHTPTQEFNQFFVSLPEFNISDPENVDDIKLNEFDDIVEKMQAEVKEANAAIINFYERENDRLYNQVQDQNKTISRQNTIDGIAQAFAGIGAIVMCVHDRITKNNTSKEDTEDRNTVKNGNEDTLEIDDTDY